MTAFTAGVLVLLTAMSAYATCDVEVMVFDYEGHKKDVTVRLEKEGGNWIQEKVSIDGIARFCDVGLGEFSITVGYGSCGQVQVSMLQISETSTKRIPVYYRNCHGFEVPSGCTVMARLTKNDGARIVGAVLLPGNFRKESDEYGRVWLRVGKGFYLASVIAPGYSPQTFTIYCDPPWKRTERTIVLDPLPSQAEPAQGPVK